MTIVVLGTNRLENCEHLIAIGPEPVLQIVLDPVAVSITLPEQASLPLVVRRNEVVHGDVRVVVSQHDVGIFTPEGHLVCNATQLEPGHVAVHLDLRPFGVSVFTDPEGLHVGKSVLAGNTIQGARTAIALG